MREKVRNKKVNCTRSCYIKNALTSVDTQEIVKVGGEVIIIYEGVVYRENVKISLFKNMLEKLFALRQKYKDEHNDLLRNLVELIMNSLYGVQIRKDIDDFYTCKAERWMQTEYDDNVLDYWRLPNGVYIVKF